MRARFAGSLIALAAILVLAAGCGGDDDATTATGGEPASGETAQGGAEREPTTSDGSADGEASGGELKAGSLGKAAFVKRIGAVCERLRKGLTQKAVAFLQKRAGEEGSPEGEAAAEMYRAVLAPVIEAEVEAVRRLGAPAGDKKQIEAILAEYEDVLDEIESLETANGLFHFQGRFEAADEGWRRLGVARCVREG